MNKHVKSFRSEVWNRVIFQHLKIPIRTVWVLHDYIRVGGIVCFVQTKKYNLEDSEGESDSSDDMFDNEGVTEGKRQTAGKIEVD